jgi:hypothetical protein
MSALLLDLQDPLHVKGKLPLPLDGKLIAPDAVSNTNFKMLTTEIDELLDASCKLQFLYLSGSIPIPGNLNR